MIDLDTNWPGELLPYERYKLFNWILDTKPKNILEVGTGGGGSTHAMSEAIKQLNIPSILYTCDPESGLSEEFFKEYPFVDFYKVKSHILIQDILITKLVDIDFILFDGSNEPDEALNELLVLEKHIKSGTYFCMHDWEFTKRGFDRQTTTKALTIRPYIEQSESWEKVEVLSGLQKNSDYNTDEFDSVGLCLYRFKRNKISLAITSFNRSDMTIRSFTQVLDNPLIDEIIIVDDHSDVNIFMKLWTLLDDLDNEKIQLHRNQVNLKPLRNKHEAVKRCRNDWVILLDSDNVIDNTYVKAVSKLNKFANTIYCPGLTYRLDGSEMWDWRPFNHYIDKKETVKHIDNALFQTLLNTGNYFCNRKKYIDVLEHVVIDESLAFNDALYYSYLWLLSGGKLKVVNSLHYIHFQHGGGEGGSWFANNINECTSVMDKLKRKIKNW